VWPLFLAAGVCAATPEVSTETVPAGGWVQIKIRGVASGQISLDLDPSVFGDIADVAVFSANGDVYGSANISGRHLDARVFKPAARGSAQVRNLPVLVIDAPVLASAPAGKTVAVTAIANGVSVIPGSVTIAGSLSVRSIAPGGGILPAGTVLHINGTGFTSSTSSSEGASYHPGKKLSQPAFNPAGQ